MNIVNFLPQRDSASPGLRVQRAISDKWNFHMYHSRCLFLQLPRFSKKQSECEELVKSRLLILFSRVTAAGNGAAVVCGFVCT